MEGRVNNPHNSCYDRLQELRRFDDSKIGVKGLVDSGITCIPRFFHHHPPVTLSDPTKPNTRRHISIPVIDLSGPRPAVVDQIRQSSSTLGFFQIINHGISKSSIDALISSFRSFFEQPNDVKSKFYHRQINRGGAYSTNFDLFQSKAASWRDTVQLRLSPAPPDGDYVAEVIKSAGAEWDREVAKLGEELMGLLEEGLGLRRERLKDMTCLDGRFMGGHYYPYCPEPNLTIGTMPHTDPGVLTVLVQNEIGGLQVKVGEEDDWIDVDPVPGAIVINIGDILQIMSNDTYKSVEHRVLANRFEEPRMSVAVFFNPGARMNMYGPLPEIISSTEKPALYKDFTLEEYIKRFLTKGLDGRTLVNCYRL